MLYDINKQKDVLLLYFCDFNYSKDNIFMLSFDVITKNKIQKGFLDVKIFSNEGEQIDNALVSVFTGQGINECSIDIDAAGYNPVRIDNVKYYPGSVCRLNVSLIPIQIADKSLRLNKKNKFSTYNDIQVFISESELQQDEIREMSMRLGMVTPKGSPSYIYAEKFAQEVNRLSNGKMKIEINTEGKLGTDRGMLLNILTDESNVDLIVQTTGSQVEFMPKLSIFDMPMVHTNRDDIRKVINNKEFYDKISSIYNSSGYKLLRFSEPLFIQLTSNKEIQNIDDFIGIKIRTLQNRNREAFWKALGATVIPLPVSEIYTSLRHGFIDSQDNPYENIIALKLYEVQKFVIRTFHLPHLVNLITSQKFYNSLNQAEKAVIEEAAANATVYARETSAESLENSMKILVENGMTILDIPEETKQVLKLKSMPIYDRIKELVQDDDLINLYIGDRIIFN